MFFIVNHENSIIAADTDFLEGLGANDIYEAAPLIKKGEVVLDELEQSISYFQQSSTFAKTELSTFLGKATLYEINKEDGQVAKESQDDALFNLAVSEESLLDEAIEEEQHNTSQEYVDEEEVEERIVSLADTEEVSPTDKESSLQPKTDKVTDTSLEIETQNIYTLEPEKNQIESQDSEIPSQGIFDLVKTDTEVSRQTTDLELSEGAEQDTDLLVDTIPLRPTEEFEEELAPISNEILPVSPQEAEALPKKEIDEKSNVSEYSLDLVAAERDIDFQERAQAIGISEAEYLYLLDEFKKESLYLEQYLRSDDPEKSEEALSVLKEASLLLHLPICAEKLTVLSHASLDERPLLIDDYLTRVKALTTTETPEKEIASEHNTPTKSKKSAKEEELLTENKDPAKILAENIIPLEKNSFSLEEIDPISFDFSINEAADDLALPVSLVNEFIVDFINQSKESLPVIQKAYEEKDLETLQATAHMLKGVSGNLRITKIEDTLHKLQFNENIAEVPDLIALFTGQLKALSLQMNQK